jgi:hypothetical protein
LTEQDIAGFQGKCQALDRYGLYNLSSVCLSSFLPAYISDDKATIVAINLLFPQVSPFAVCTTHN